MMTTSVHEFPGFLGNVRARGNLDFQWDGVHAQREADK